MHSLPNIITAYVILATEPKIIIIREHLHVSVQPICVSECESENRKGCIFHFPALGIPLGVKITQAEPCDITGSLMCTLSPRSPLNEEDVHNSFNRIIAENSESVAPPEAFELQQLQWALTAEGEGILVPSCS